jgi:hypothetical protein
MSVLKLIKKSKNVSKFELQFLHVTCNAFTNCEIYSQKQKVILFIGLGKSILDRLTILFF